MTHYQHTQYGKLIIIIIALLTLITLTFSIIETDRFSITTTETAFVLIIFFIIFLMFYKLTITITNEEIEAKFGIGLLKRSLKVKDINYNTIEKIKVPFLYGIGIRLTPYGWLYNVNTGHAIKMKSDTKTFFVGTEDFEKIHSILLKLKP